MFLRRRQRRQYKLSDTDSADRRLRLSNADDGGVLCKCVCVCVCACVCRDRERTMFQERAPVQAPGTRADSVAFSFCFCFSFRRSVRAAITGGCCDESV